MTTNKPTIVLIHGGWHTPASYSKLTTALRSSDYEVHVPRLPTVNEIRPPNTDLATDTVLARSYVESLVEAGRTVAVLMHSYGGQVGTNALSGLGLNSRAREGLTGGVSHLIYMTASAFSEGVSMMDKVKEFNHEHLVPLAFDIAEDGSCVSRDLKNLVIGPGVDDCELDAYISTLVRWNGKAMYQPLTNCAWREIPVRYIYTTKDMTVPLEYQKSMVEYIQGQGHEVQTVELETGHCPNLTMTAGVVDAVNQFLVGQK